jgi:mono/diheme cytochrome c family protein
VIRTSSLLRSSLLLCMMMAAASAIVAQGTDPDWTAPAKDAARKNPFASKPQLAAGGEKIFTRSCTSCHGEAARRAGNKAPDLGSEAVQSESDGAIFWKITNGNTRKAMPAWGVLPEPQRWQLVLYLRSLREQK